MKGDTTFTRCARRSPRGGGTLGSQEQQQRFHKMTALRAFNVRLLVCSDLVGDVGMGERPRACLLPSG